MRDDVQMAQATLFAWRTPSEASATRCRCDSSTVRCASRTQRFRGVQPLQRILIYGHTGEQPTMLSTTEAVDRLSGIPS